MHVKRKTPNPIIDETQLLKQGAIYNDLQRHTMTCNDLQRSTTLQLILN